MGLLLEGDVYGNHSLPTLPGVRTSFLPLHPSIHNSLLKTLTIDLMKKKATSTAEVNVVWERNCVCSSPGFFSVHALMEILITPHLQPFVIHVFALAFPPPSRFTSFALPNNIALLLICHIERKNELDIGPCHQRDLIINVRIVTAWGPRISKVVWYPRFRRSGFKLSVAPRPSSEWAQFSLRLRRRLSPLSRKLHS